MKRCLRWILLLLCACYGTAFALPPCPAAGYYHLCAGKESWPNGNRYVGEYKSNKKHGQGVYTAANGDSFSGEFKDGTYNGIGTYRFANGSVYSGEFKDGKRTGQGVFTRADGSTVVGEWLGDLAQGRVMEFARDATLLRSGLYDKGRLVSPYALTLSMFPRLAENPVVQAILGAQAARQAAEAARVAAAEAEKLAQQRALAEAQQLAEAARLAAEAAEQRAAEEARLTRERQAEEARQAQAAMELLAAERARAQAEAQAQRQVEEARQAQAVADLLAAQQAQGEAQQQAADALLAAQAADKQAAERSQTEAQPVPPRQVTPRSSGTSAATLPIKDCAECPDMVLLPSGSLQMKLDKSADPKTGVTVEVRSFAIGKTEVTQRQWKAIMGDNPSRFVACGPDCPVDNVSWKDVAQFIRKLNQKTGQNYRLPSESEWEYAARGGNTAWLLTEPPPALEDHAWYIANSQKTSHPVAGKKANPFGLHDLYGNVWEWVEDCYHDSYAGLPTDGSAWASACASPQRVLRGGSWSDEAGSMRNRGRYAPEVRNLITGFRLARSPSPP